LRLFLASFVVLFFEIALIRWVPAHVRLLSYFSNFILLASFLGIGVGCLLASSRLRLFRWYPLLLAGLVAGVRLVRLEVAVPSATTIYFSSGTRERVVAVESTLLLPIVFAVVAALFVALAERMGREMARLPPLRAYAWNLAGSLAGVAAFALVSWLELGPTWWFATGMAASLPLLLTGDADTPAPAGSSSNLANRRVQRAATVAASLAALAAALAIVDRLAAGSQWSPYYRITVRQEGADTVVEVNNIFHQSMAPLDRKEYFYEWAYRVFGDRFSDVLVLGAGTGTDVAAALRHGARRVDAVEIDPAILRLGGRHPDRPYDDPRVRTIVDDARHFLRTTGRKYDLVVFALIDSLTLQSAFAGVRLESYMFTREAFEAVRARLRPGGLLVVYNYFREPWLVDRLANTAAAVFGGEPWVHVHPGRAHLAVLMAGPRLRELQAPPPVPDRVQAFGQPDVPSAAVPHRRDRSIPVATDDWPFLYMRHPHLPGHYLAALAWAGVISVAAVAAVLGPTAARVRASPRGFVHFFCLGAGFMLLETRAVTQFALLWGSTWSSASLAIASVLVMALASVLVAARAEIRSRWAIGAPLAALLALGYALPVGRVAFESRALESVVCAALVFSPVFFGGLLFSRSIRRSDALARDYGVNLLGAMTGGIAEYLALVTGYQFLLLLVAGCYLLAIATAPALETRPAPALEPVRARPDAASGRSLY
jgi:spermidine synthase